MKINKSVIALLSTSLLVGATFSTPALSPVANAASKDQVNTPHIDWSLVNQDKLERALKKQGKLKPNATEAEVQKAIQAYVKKGTTPHAETDGIDTSSKFGKKAEKGMKGLQQRVAKKIAGLTEEDNPTLAAKEKNKSKQHKENGVVALIEFPDYEHNQIEKESPHDFWVKDFNQDHYKNLLFNANGFTTDSGEKLPSFRQYYLEQSVGYWDVDGIVTPWTKAKHNAAYYGAHDEYDNDTNPRELVMETLESVGKQIAGNEAQYDTRDPYDLDSDGNVMEPDGILDALFIVHSGSGEEAGGGALGENAIWSHRSVIGTAPVTIPGTTLKAYDYIIQPEDGAAGVFAHEYGHNIGLPDEYDVAYSGTGSPVEYWSLMSGGSWSGKILGTEPTGFSAWAKLFFHETYGGNWPVPKVIDYAKLKNKKSLKLNEAVANQKDGKLLKINLPDVYKQAATQPLEKLSYFSTKGDSLNTKMVSSEIDLTNAKVAQLSFDTWRDTEEGYDFVYLNIYADNSSTPTQIKKFTGTNGKWENEVIDLSPFAGKMIKVEFNYVSDIAVAQEGFFVDNIVVTADDNQVFSDDAEGTPKFTFEGFQTFDGSATAFPNYYLVEWRTHNGVDQALGHIRRSNDLMSYDAGMVVWYYDGRYGEDNMTGKHPGEGFLGVVDSHQNGHYWSDGKVGTTRYQLNDAAFGLAPTSALNLNFPTATMKYDSTPGISTFYDGNNYSSPYNPAGGKILPKNGLKVEVKKVNKTGTQVSLEVSKVK